ncbi:acylneuraminate cytidylyltransferase family protein [Pseudomonas sp. S2_C03]
MKILAIIPARGGSKRLVGKNIKILGGRPLIAWTIEAALQSGVVTDVIISTDDMATAAIAREFGGNVLNIRPAHLATDTASSFDVVTHVLNEYEFANGSVDGVMLLQPTSPFRTAESIQRAVLQFRKDTSRSIVSVASASSHPAWCFKLEGDTMTPFLGWDNLSKRSQDLEPAYTLTGSIYLLSPKLLREQKGFLGLNTIPLVITSNTESLDIDTPEDWSVAERVLEQIAIDKAK